MRVHLPILLALSANSPFWRGVPTGLMSTRTPIFKTFPRVGVPPRYESWSDFVARVEFMVDAKAVEDYTYFWWDVRPHPKFGTVEVRVCDAQTRLEYTVALAALVQCMCKELAEHYEAGYELGTYPQEMLEENKWLAARYGIEAELVDLPQTTRCSGVSLARRLVDRLRAHADDLGCARELEGVEEMVERGTGAQRQLAVWRADRDLRLLVRKIAEATALGVTGRVAGSESRPGA
jgi:carboxylate-amine ligase